MAVAKSNKAHELFMEYYVDIDPVDLINWIIELLPQDDFDRYVKDIVEEMNDE